MVYDTYPVGTVVKVKKRMSQPSNWNEDMFNDIAGMTLKVVSNSMETITSGRKYIYTLEGYRWSWRHIDLKLVKAAELEPNLAFRIKKHGRR